MPEPASPQVVLSGVPWMDLRLVEVDAALAVAGGKCSALRLDIAAEGTINATYRVPHNAAYGQVKAIVYHSLIEFDLDPAKKRNVLSFVYETPDAADEIIPISTPRDWITALAYLKEKFGTGIWRLRIREADDESKTDRRACITMQDPTMQEILKLRDEKGRASAQATFGDMTEQKANQLRVMCSKFAGVFKQMPWMKPWFDAAMRCDTMREKLIRIDANQMQALAYARKDVQLKLANLIKAAEKIRIQTRAWQRTIFIAHTKIIGKPATSKEQVLKLITELNGLETAAMKVSHFAHNLNDAEYVDHIKQVLEVISALRAYFRSCSLDTFNNIIAANNAIAVCMGKHIDDEMYDEQLEDYVFVVGSEITDVHETSKKWPPSVAMAGALLDDEDDQEDAVAV